MPTDQVLEQTINKDSKGAGGLIGISRDENARTKWFLTSHVRAHLYGAQKQMCNSQTHSLALPHKEDNPAITTKDEADIQSLINAWCNCNRQIFKKTPTGAKPDENTTRNILSAIEAGSRRAKAFIDEQIVNRTKPLDATLQNKTCLLLIT